MCCFPGNTGSSRKTPRGTPGEIVHEIKVVFIAVLGGKRLYNDHCVRRFSLLGHLKAAFSLIWSNCSVLG